MDKHIIIIKEFLFHYISGPWQDRIVNWLLIASIMFMAVIAYFLCKGALYLLGFAIDKSPTKWDNDLIDHHLMRAVSQLAPAIVIDRLLPAFFRLNESDYVHWISVLTSFYILWAIVRIVVIFIGNLYTAMNRRRRTKPYAVKGIFQMLKLITIGVGIIIGISILIGKEPMVILTALGASAAVLMLVFKDTILGLVASVQLTANKMLHKGDWIVAEKHGANGEVEDVSLTTVKVRNWDNSISTIPPYALISESFRNYQPMRSLGGRCLERAFYIDAASVRFCTEPELHELERRGWLEGIAVDNASRQVNLTLLRRYLEAYLAAREDINHAMLYMVRQLQPTPSGLPIQLYCYTGITGWKEFEHLQSDILDHVYAAVPIFGLRIFQTPAGTDLHPLAPFTTN